MPNAALKPSRPWVEAGTPYRQRVALVACPKCRMCSEVERGAPSEVTGAAHALEDVVAGLRLDQQKEHGTSEPMRLGQHGPLGGEVPVHDDQIERLAHHPAVAGDPHAPEVAEVRIGEDGHPMASAQGLLARRWTLYSLPPG